MVGDNDFNAMQSLVGETIMASDYEYALFNENADVWYTEIELKKQMDEECIDEDEVWVYAFESDQWT